jgi:acyl-CoA thioesterase-1
MMVPPNLGKEYTNDFRNIYPELAKKNSATLMPFLLEGVAGDEKLNLPDGIHPNVQGHKIVAGNLAKVISPLLK